MQEKLFFELLQVALDVRPQLDAAPSAQEWAKMMRMAREQALVGVCFAGVKKLERSGQLVNLPSSLKMQWLATAMQIQRQNEIVDRCCSELSDRLRESGYDSCLLKGQGLARLYEHVSGLGSLRQPGDIDMWMLAEPEVALDWVRKTGRLESFDYHHADVQLFSDVEVELHYRPSVSRNLMRNSRLQHWFRKCGKEHIVYNESLGCHVPDWTFNVVLSLNHIFWHLMFEGVGLRQLMDFYFVLKTCPEELHAKKNVLELLRRFHLLRFAGAVMWVEREVFGLCEENLLCEPDERLGRFLLDEIMRAGNFGHHDDRLKGTRSGGRLHLMWRWMKHSMRLLRHYPEDVLWTPVGIVYISMWRRVKTCIWKVKTDGGRIS